MNIKSQIIWVPFSSFLLLTACSHQATPLEPNAVPAVVNQPITKKPVQQALPLPQHKPLASPKPYHDIVMESAALPPVVVSTTVVRPTPAVSPFPIPSIALPLPTVTSVPKVKAKGNYRGAVSVDDSLRQQYQQ